MPSADDECGEMDSKIRTEILEILGLVMQWELPVSRWDAIELVLGEMTIALFAGDIKALSEVAMDLERDGPLRLRTRIGDEPRVRAPVKVRERVNRLIHDLGPQEGTAGGDSSDPGEDTADDEASNAY